MSALRELYQEVIIDHSRQPRNFGKLVTVTHQKEGFNPLCGDKLTLYIAEENNQITNISFEGCGCAISMASASLMTETLKYKSLAEVEAIFINFHQLVTMGFDAKLADQVGKLAVLAGVAEFPARVKCATLAWHTLKSALAQDSQPVCTE